MRLIPSGRTLGAKIEDLDLSRPLEEGAVDRIIQALGRHGVVCFPRQKLTPRQQKDFAARFGELEINVASGPYQEPGIPEVMTLSNIVKDGKPIGLALVQAAVEPLRQERLPIERVFPEDGPGVLTGGFGVVMKIKGGPHPNAATLFVNWFAGREGQEMYEREMMETSLRADVGHQVPDYVIPKAGVAYPVDSYDPGQFFGSTVPTIARLTEILSR